MKPPKLNLKIGDLLDRAMQGEDLRLPGGYDGVLALVEGTLGDLQTGRTLHQEQREFLIELIKECLLPPVDGRPRGGGLAREEAAEAYEWGRKRKAALIDTGVGPTEATAITVRELQKRLPHLSAATLKDRLLRRRQDR